MGALPDQDEAVRRVRAALAYAGMDGITAMRVLSISRSTLQRLVGRKGSESRRVDWAELWLVADACGLPREWFSADLSRLAEIVPADAPLFRSTAAGASEGPPGELGRIAQGSPPIAPAQPRSSSPPGTGARRRSETG
jgi:hypothetical protein